MVGVLVGAEDAVDAFGKRAAQGFKAPHHFFFAKPGVDKEGGAVCFEQRCVARPAISENRYAKKDVPRPSARENREPLRILTELQPLVKNRNSIRPTNFTKTTGPAGQFSRYSSAKMARTSAVLVIFCGRRFTG